MGKKFGYLILFLTVFFSFTAVNVYGEVLTGNKTQIDTSYAGDGYVNVKTTAATKKLKVTIEKGGTKYTYDMFNDGTTNSYPLQLGNGQYYLKVLENVEGAKYSMIQDATFNASMSNEFAPYLNANIYVNYKTDSNIVKIAANVTSGCQTDLEKLDKIYSYVASLIQYDTNKASGVQPGYIPNIDNVLSAKTGICYDYAAVMAAMLRSQNIPTKLVTGYVSKDGNVYHAWNEAYIKGVGWVKTGELYFDGQNWKIMDATFMSTAQASQEVQEFIGDGTHYTQQFEY